MHTVHNTFCISIHLPCFRLASHMCGYKCFQIELSRGYDYNAFHDDLKKLYDMAGVQNQNTVFLFTDTQVGIIQNSLSIEFRSKKYYVQKIFD